MEEGTAGPPRLLSSSVVVQIKSKMIYSAKRGDDFLRGGPAPGIVGIRQLLHCRTCREEEVCTWTPDRVLHETQDHQVGCKWSQGS